MRRIAAVLACLMLFSLLANAAPRHIQIKVLDSETRALSGDDNNGVPLDCEQLTFDAYCRSTTNVPLVSILLVQEGDGPPFRIRCTIQSRFSRCTPLPKGATLDARREKKGVTVYYEDEKGKMRSELYTLVAAQKGDAAKAATPAPVDAGSRKAAPGADGNEVQPASGKSAPAATGKAIQPAVQTNDVVVGAEHTAELSAKPSSAPRTVKCNFTSTPAGAEVTVDGRYVGSTPSVIGLSTGAHAVVVSIAGFERWKRDLTVEAGSELTVNAVLQKSQ